MMNLDRNAGTRYSLGLPIMPWEKQFDRAVALDRAERVFRKFGYERSSMSVLLKGMGIQKGSFYATFGSKHKILLETLALYIQRRFDSFQAVTVGRSPLEALRQHLDEVYEESVGPDRGLGCFLVNCATELAPRDREVRTLIARTLKAHAAFYESLLNAAKIREELPEDYDAAQTADALLGLVLGMRVFARGGASTTQLHSLRRQADALIAC